MEAVRSVVECTNSGKFVLKMGNEFNMVAEKYNMTNRELFALIFDYVLSSQLNTEDGEEKLVASIKYRDPRVTLLVVRKTKFQTMVGFKEQFLNEAVCYLTSANPAQKNFHLVMRIEPEKS